MGGGGGGYRGPRPPISEPIDLLQHNCLVYTLQPTDRWFFRHKNETGDAFEEVPVTGTLRADDSEPLRDAADAGAGGALLPTWLGGGQIKTGGPREGRPPRAPPISPRTRWPFRVFFLPPP